VASYCVFLSRLHPSPMPHSVATIEHSMEAMWLGLAKQEGRKAHMGWVDEATMGDVKQAL
jgi:hypothetical protein